MEDLESMEEFCEMLSFGHDMGIVNMWAHINSGYLHLLAQDQINQKPHKGGEYNFQNPPICETLPSVVISGELENYSLLTTWPLMGISKKGLIML